MFYVRKWICGENNCDDSPQVVMRNYAENDVKQKRLISPGSSVKFERPPKPSRVPGGYGKKYSQSPHVDMQNNTTIIYTDTK